MESKSALSAMQKLETRSDEELEAETRFRAAAQAILGARAAERMDAKRSREHFRAAIAAARPQERLQLRRMAEASLALAERRPADLKAAAEKLGQTPPTNRQLLALRFMGLVAPPPGAPLWLRARGILLIILLVVVAARARLGDRPGRLAAVRRRRLRRRRSSGVSCSSASCSACCSSSDGAGRRRRARKPGRGARGGRHQRPPPLGPPPGRGSRTGSLPGSPPDTASLRWDGGGMNPATTLRPPLRRRVPRTGDGGARRRRPRLRPRRGRGARPRRRHAVDRPRHVHRRSWGRRAPASRRCCSSPPGWTGRRRASVRLGEHELGGLGERALARLRRERIGFVFQSFNLLGALTAEQNVALPARLAGRRLPRVGRARRARARRARRPRAATGPAQLSGGQQQRVAIARALVGEPDVDVRRRADRRAGHALRPRGARAPARRRSTRAARTLVMVTHDPSAAAWADRVVFMADGRLAGELHAPTAEQVAERLTGLGA